MESRPELKRKLRIRQWITTVLVVFWFGLELWNTRGSFWRLHRTASIFLDLALGAALLYFVFVETRRVRELMGELKSLPPD